MTRAEKRATVSLASVYAFRMLGLFLIMPVLSLYAGRLEGATPALIGLAIGIYGMLQALLQIPFGLLSDRLGRKKVIIAGLLLFLIGSIVAALSTSIFGIILGRAIQGSGAVAASVMALVADLTQEVHRTKAMAMIGASIGMSFGIAITLGPVLASYIGINGIFWLIAGLAIVAIFIVAVVVPSPKQAKKHREAQVIPSHFSDVLSNPELLRLNAGIFILHIVMTASFIAVPVLLREAGLPPVRHWLAYLPVFVGSLALMIPFIILAEKKRQMKKVFLGAVTLLVVAFLGLMQWHATLAQVLAGLLIFFSGFNLLEATLPSLVSKTAPGDRRGTAMGIYSTCQFLGAGFGGSVGGWTFGHFGATGLFTGCAALVCVWLVLAAGMRPPRYWANLLLPLENFRAEDLNGFEKNLLNIAGVEDVTLHPEESVAFLKVDNSRLDKEVLQQLLAQYGNK